MLFEILQFLINSLFFDFEAFVVAQLYLGALALDFVDELLVLGVDHFQILDSAHFHGFVQGVAFVDEIYGFLTVLFELSNDRLPIFLEHIH